MSGLIEFLKRRFGGGRPDPKLAADPFPPLDAEAVRQATRLLAAARADGFKELPGSDAAQESPTERNIRAHCERERDRHLSNFERHRQAYLTRIIESCDGLSAAGINRVEQVLVENVVAVARKSAGPIAASASKLRNLADELRTFRAENDLLGRGPKYHDAWWSWFFLLLVLAVELAVTTLLLRESGGLAMVITLSAMYCFLNCIVPFVAAHRFDGSTIDSAAPRCARLSAGWFYRAWSPRAGP